MKKAGRESIYDFADFLFFLQTDKAFSKGFMKHLTLDEICLLSHVVPYYRKGVYSDATA